MLSIRPKVAELAFSVYGKAVHPELFEVAGSRTLSRGGYRAAIDITSSGHVVTWNFGDLTFTEVCASAHQALPERRRLIHYRLVGLREDRFTTECGVTYRMSVAIRTMAPQLFWDYQRQVACSQQEPGLLHEFLPSGRVAMGAVSYVLPEARDYSLRIRSTHTFPDDYAVVVTRSIIEIPKRLRPAT